MKKIIIRVVVVVADIVKASQKRTNKRTAGVVVSDQCYREVS